MRAIELSNRKQSLSCSNPGYEGEIKTNDFFGQGQGYLTDYTTNDNDRRLTPEGTTKEHHNKQFNSLPKLQPADGELSNSTTLQLTDGETISDIPSCTDSISSIQHSERNDSLMTNSNTNEKNLRMANKYTNDNNDQPFNIIQHFTSSQLPLSYNNNNQMPLSRKGKGNDNNRNFSPDTNLHKQPLKDIPTDIPRDIPIDIHNKPARGIPNVYNRENADGDSVQLYTQTSPMSSQRRYHNEQTTEISNANQVSNKPLSFLTLSNQENERYVEIREPEYQMSRVPTKISTSAQMKERHLPISPGNAFHKGQRPLWDKTDKILSDNCPSFTDDEQQTTQATFLTHQQHIPAAGPSADFHNSHAVNRLKPDEWNAISGMRQPAVNGTQYLTETNMMTRLQSAKVHTPSSYV